MTGGTIADGKYFLTKIDQFNGETGNTPHQETWVFSGSSVQIAEVDGTTSERFSGTISANANVLTLTLTCPASLAGTVIASPFTATGNQLTTIDSHDANEMSTYTQQ
jgi:hypothetical protein